MKNGGSRSRRIEIRGEGESPYVFGPFLSSSFVPKLRLFSWPSFSRFVHPWTQGRAQVRKRERQKESDSEESGKKDEARGGRRGGLVETW